jgi:hypothetical protein
MMTISGIIKTISYQTKMEHSSSIQQKLQLDIFLKNPEAILRGEILPLGAKFSLRNEDTVLPLCSSKEKSAFTLPWGGDQRGECSALGNSPWGTNFTPGANSCCEN